MSTDFCGQCCSVRATVLTRPVSSDVYNLSKRRKWSPEEVTKNNKPQMWCLHGWDAAKIARRQKMADIPLGFAIAHNVVEVERYVCNIARNSFVSGID